MWRRAAAWTTATSTGSGEDFALCQHSGVGRLRRCVFSCCGRPLAAGCSAGQLGSATDCTDCTHPWPCCHQAASLTVPGLITSPLSCSCPQLPVLPKLHQNGCQPGEAPIPAPNDCMHVCSPSAPARGSGRRTRSFLPFPPCQLLFDPFLSRSPAFYPPGEVLPPGLPELQAQVHCGLVSRPAPGDECGSERGTELDTECREQGCTCQPLDVMPFRQLRVSFF